MKPKQGILLFGLIEIGIGTVTLAAIGRNLLAGVLPKPPNVLAFVVISSLISICLGAGILCRRPYARKFLIFFAGWVILSKILIFAGIIVLCCEMETTMAPDIKNIISILYHIAVITYFHSRSIKAEFKP
jgi:uncharacterized protein YybS (DUF2232 family)